MPLDYDPGDGADATLGTGDLEVDINAGLGVGPGYAAKGEVRL